MNTIGQAPAGSFSESAVNFEKKILLEKVAKMSNLPTPSGTIMEIMLKLRNEDIEIKEIVVTVRRDQSLVAQILKMINSGYYGLRNQIDSVERAVNLLGIIKIKQIVYAASIMDMFSDEERLEWNHAYTSSLLMGFLLEDQKIPAASNLPLVMLMHDIGKLVLRRFAPTKYKLAKKQSELEQRPLYQIEEGLIHVDHAEIGAWLLERWQMTEEIIKPVRYHHLQTVPPDFQIETMLTQFVDWVDNMARGCVAATPSPELGKHTGFEIVDTDYWINTQRNFIVSVEGQQDGREQEKKVSLPAPTGFTNTKTSKMQKSKVAALVKSDATEATPDAAAHTHAPAAQPPPQQPPKAMEPTVSVHEQPPPPTPEQSVSTKTDRVNRRTVMAPPPPSPPPTQEPQPSKTASGSHAIMVPPPSSAPPTKTPQASKTASGSHATMVPPPTEATKGPQGARGTTSGRAPTDTPSKISKPSSGTDKTTVNLQVHHPKQGFFARLLKAIFGK